MGYCGSTMGIVMPEQAGLVGIGGIFLVINELLQEFGHGKNIIAGIKK